MADNNFKIRRLNGSIILEKGNQGIAISQAVDEDICFTASEEEQSLELSMYSRNYHE